MDPQVVAAIIAASVSALTLIGTLAAQYFGRRADATVDFSNVSDWSCPPEFPWTDSPPPGVKLPKKEDQSKA